MTINSYKDLKVWQNSMSLVTHVYKITNNFPQDEKFGLVSQMRRAAVSIPSNIAEGYSRHSTKEYIQFLFVSLGSLAELETQLFISQNLGYSKIDDSIFEIITELGKMIRGLQRSLPNSQNIIKLNPKS